jgi:hypothetical protein
LTPSSRRIFFVNHSGYVGMLSVTIPMTEALN